MARGFHGAHPSFKCRKCGQHKGRPAFRTRVKGGRKLECIACEGSRKRARPKRLVWRPDRHASHNAGEGPPPPRPEGEVLVLAERMVGEMEARLDGHDKAGVSPEENLRPLWEAGRFKEWAQTCAWATWRVRYGAGREG